MSYLEPRLFSDICCQLTSSDNLDRATPLSLVASGGGGNRTNNVRTKLVIYLEHNFRRPRADLVLWNRLVPNHGDCQMAPGDMTVGSTPIGKDNGVTGNEAGSKETLMRQTCPNRPAASSRSFMDKNAQRSKTVKVLSRGYVNESSGASTKARFQKSGSPAPQAWIECGASHRPR